MSDIFISYASQDRERILPLVRGLEKTGWSIFWDRTIPAGKTWREWIEGEIRNARCIVVVWSAAAVDSQWVHEEAVVGKKKKILIPVMLENVEPPLGFSSIQAANLVGWDGDFGSPPFQQLLGAIALIPGIGPAGGDGRKPGVEKQPGEQVKLPDDTPATWSSWPVPGKGIAVMVIVIAVALAGVLANKKIRFRLQHGSEIPEMLFISGGEFVMGSDPETDADSQGAEQPAHRVQVNDFYIGKYEVSFDEYDLYAHANNIEPPGDIGFGRGKRPVISVSREDAQAYANWLGEQTGDRYRLPTEAEWEYAARAGTETRYWWGDAVDQDGKLWANCYSCTRQWDKTAPAGQFPANAFGLHDTAGNVWEWVQDCWHDSYAGETRPDDGSAWEGADGGDCERGVIRGGSWYHAPMTLRSAYRFEGGSAARYYFRGFRLARDI